jgi:hypothetical protein
MHSVEACRAREAVLSGSPIDRQWGNSDFPTALPGNPHAIENLVMTSSNKGVFSDRLRTLYDRLAA